MSNDTKSAQLRINREVFCNHCGVGIMTSYQLDHAVKINCPSCNKPIVIDWREKPQPITGKCEMITIPKREYDELKFKLWVAENDIKATQITNEFLLKENQRLIKYQLGVAYGK